MDMRYWGLLAAKFALVGVFMAGVYLLGTALLPEPVTHFGLDTPLFTNLGYTITIFLYWLLGAGLVWLAIWDQRYRCRTCARKLRMPIATGDWTHVLLSRPRTEYICIWGHGTLKVEELQITGSSSPDWQPHGEDIWKELVALEKPEK